MIFLGDEHIGGYHDLLKLVEEESFHPMIAKFKIQDWYFYHFVQIHTNKFLKQRGFGVLGFSG